jgi:hypothetical protein
MGQADIGLRDARYSWAEIAARLGVTRQAAQQRWANRRETNALRRVSPRCPRITVNSQRPPWAMSCEHEASAGIEHVSNAP